jgi:hypothetical protein
VHLLAVLSTSSVVGRDATATSCHQQWPTTCELALRSRKASLNLQAESQQAGCAIGVVRPLTAFVLPERCTAASTLVHTSLIACATARSAAAGCCTDMVATARRLAAIKAMQLWLLCS